MSRSDWDIEWEYTWESVAVHGSYYKGWPQIGRDESVVGGVSYGDYFGEALLVDYNRYPPIYDEWYNAALHLASLGGPEVHKHLILGAIYETVRQRMRYSQEGVQALLDTVAQEEGRDRFRNGDLVDLSAFMVNGVGTCLHQAAAAAALIEGFQRAGYLGGQVSLDRNRAVRRSDGRVEGHAWARYTTEDGRQVIILDVAGGYFGPIENTGPDDWDYFRPDNC